MGLERQLSAWEFEMHLQEALVGLPALAWYLTTAYNSKFKRSDPLFWSYRHQEITPRAYTPKSKTIIYVKYNKLILKTLKMSKGLFICFLKVYFIFICVSVCSCVSLCVYVYAYSVCMCVLCMHVRMGAQGGQKKKNGVGLPEARVEGGYKPLGMSARNQTQVLGKRS